MEKTHLSFEYKIENNEIMYTTITCKHVNGGRDKRMRREWELGEDVEKRTSDVFDTIAQVFFT